MGVHDGALGRAALLVLVLATACGAAAPPPVTKPAAGEATPAPAPMGVVVFDCDPGEATVSVDGEPRGTTQAVSTAGGLRLPLGLHRFEISHPGYAPYRIELNIGTTPERLRVKLKPIRR